MSRKLAGMALALTAGLALGACSTEDGNDDDTPVAGTSGAGGTSAGSGAGGAGGTDGTGGSAGKGGTAGSSGGSSPGGSGGSSDAGTGGVSGGSGGSSGTAGSGGAEASCTPASTDGIAYTGTCTFENLCTDNYDVAFGVEALQQLCEDQEGVWSSTPCAPAAWDIRCTQAEFDGVYVQYMPADDICVGGCEEAL